jgi:hypothetical protein
MITLQNNRIRCDNLPQTGADALSRVIDVTAPNWYHGSISWYIAFSWILRMHLALHLDTGLVTNENDDDLVVGFSH